jgi:hypothetical protein
MAKKKAKSTISTVATTSTEAVAKAAPVTANAARAASGVMQEYVVEPVEKALGLTKTPKPKAANRPRPSSRRPIN